SFSARVDGRRMASSILGSEIIVARVFIREVSLQPYLAAHVPHRRFTGGSSNQNAGKGRVLCISHRSGRTTRGVSARNAPGGIKHVVSHAFAPPSPASFVRVRASFSSSRPFDREGFGELAGRSRVSRGVVERLDRQRDRRRRCRCWRVAFWERSRTRHHCAGRAKVRTRVRSSREKVRNSKGKVSRAFPAQKRMRGRSALIQPGGRAFVRCFAQRRDRLEAADGASKDRVVHVG